MKKLLVLIFLIIAGSPIFAQEYEILKQIIKSNPDEPKIIQKHTQPCVVQFLSKEGWSEKYLTDVTFISGSLLNKIVCGINYSESSTYALILWGEDKVTIIKIATLLPCRNYIDRYCLDKVIGKIRGKDQYNNKWKICANGSCLK